LSIAIETSKSNRLRAALAANPSADPLPVASDLGLIKTEANNAPSRTVASRIKTTAE